MEYRFRARSIETQQWLYFGLTNVPKWVDESEANQYTGLEDKNGIPIFEGDILKVAGSRRYVVRWNGEEMAFSVSYKYANGEPAEWILSEFRDVLKTFEIIGNIYENPELLEG